MRNLLILGSGRSGTSMATSLFRNTGAFLGEQLIDATESNPYGYFESRVVNEINTNLIHKMLKWPYFNRKIRPFVESEAHSNRMASWLAAPRRLREIMPAKEDQLTMEEYVAREPFCFKDPRFNLTLHLWKELLPKGTRFLVVFRSPELTVNSVLRDIQIYEPPLRISTRWAYLSWYRHYKFLLNIHSLSGEWLFIHYDDILSRRAMTAIANFSETTLDESLLDPKISKSKSKSNKNVWTHPLSRCQSCYTLLRKRSADDLQKWSE